MTFVYLIDSTYHPMFQHSLFSIRPSWMCWLPLLLSNPCTRLQILHTIIFPVHLLFAYCCTQQSFHALDSQAVWSRIGPTLLSILSAQWTHRYFCQSRDGVKERSKWEIRLLFFFTFLIFKWVQTKLNSFKIIWVGSNYFFPFRKTWETEYRKKIFYLK